MSETDDQILNRGAPERNDPFAYAPPGHSLTQDNTRWPWGGPPRDSDPEAALEKAIAGLKKPKIRHELIKLLMVGVSVEVIVEGFLLQGFQDGKFNPDVAVLIKPALGLFIADMAEDENIPYRLFENDNTLDEGEMDDETFFRMMKDNNPRMFEFIREKVNSQIRAGVAPREIEEDESFMTMMKGDE
tara:strand:+ start:1304 stop:1864 length:561 start_codon:yes stop_codon:yes gene_type:complete